MNISHGRCDAILNVEHLMVNTYRQRNKQTRKSHASIRMRNYPWPTQIITSFVSGRAPKSLSFSTSSSFVNWNPMNVAVVDNRRRRVWKKFRVQTNSNICTDVYAIQIDTYYLPLKMLFQSYYTFGWVCACAVDGWLAAVWHRGNFECLQTRMGRYHKHAPICPEYWLWCIFTCAIREHNEWAYHVDP